VQEGKAIDEKERKTGERKGRMERKIEAVQVWQKGKKLTLEPLFKEV
jgi:hypothetical protein